MVYLCYVNVIPIKTEKRSHLIAQMCQNANQVHLGQHTCQAVLNPKLGPDGGQGQKQGRAGESRAPHTREGQQGLHPSAGLPARRRPLVWIPSPELTSSPGDTWAPRH